MIGVKNLEVGKTYLVSSRFARSPLSETYTPYPWGDENTRVPIKVLEEYEHSFVCDVLPHTTRCTPRSKPYRITVDKFALIKEDFKAYTEEVEDEISIYRV